MCRKYAMLYRIDLLWPLWRNFGGPGRPGPSGTGLIPLTSAGRRAGKGVNSAPPGPLGSHRHALRAQEDLPRDTQPFRRGAAVPEDANLDAGPLHELGIHVGNGEADEPHGVERGLYRRALVMPAAAR